jgi:hypothetical protein
METWSPSGQSPNKLEPQFEAKSLHCALSLSVNANQVFALQQTELLLLHTGLRTHRRPGMFLAAFAMTMPRPDERRLNLETDSAAEATSSNNFAHVSDRRGCGGVSIDSVTCRRVTLSSPISRRLIFARPMTSRPIPMKPAASALMAIAPTSNRTDRLRPDGQRANCNRTELSPYFLNFV